MTKIAWISDDHIIPFDNIDVAIFDSYEESDHDYAHVYLSQRKECFIHPSPH